VITLVIASPKGGVGKTTVSLNLSYAMAKHGFRVLLVDTDPQGAIGLGISEKLKAVPGFAEYVTQDVPLERLRVKTKMAGLDLLVLGQIPAQFTTRFGSLLEDGRAFSKLIAEAKPAYDLMIIDSPCGFNGPTMGAFKAADYVISPVQAEPVCVRSIPQLMNVLSFVRKEGAPVMMLGFLISMWQKDHQTSQDIVNELQSRFPERMLFRTMIPRDNIFMKASEMGVPLGLLSRRLPPQAFIFEQLAFEIEKRLQLGQEGDDEPISLLD